MGKLIVLGVVGVFFLLFTGGCYVSLFTGWNGVQRDWSNVETTYQNRADTVPNFAKNAKFSLKFQKELAIGHAAAREGVKSAAVSFDPETLQRNANEKYNAMLIAVRQEAVPEAKLDQLTELNAIIENVERTIRHARQKYNDTCTSYRNKKVLLGGLISSVFGFMDCKLFSADPGAEKSPTYDLDWNK